jgi:general stress protein YciG
MSRIPWQPRCKPGPRPGSPGAKRCGQVLRQLGGHEFWVQLGQLGGTVNRLIHGPEGLAKAGRKGGKATLAEYGREHFVEMGRRSQERAAQRRQFQQQPQRW